MKALLIIAVFILTIFSSFNESSALSIFRDRSEIIYCQDNECSLSEWTKIVKNDLNDIEKNRTTSQYIQDVVAYLLTFITIIAVFYIIYAWFKVLTSAWNDDDVKKSKTTIISVFIWILIIWLSYTIVKWIIWVVVN